jgi:hypothetical protein
MSPRCSMRTEPRLAHPRTAETSTPTSSAAASIGTEAWRMRDPCLSVMDITVGWMPETAHRPLGLRFRSRRLDRLAAVPRAGAGSGDDPRISKIILSVSQDLRSSKPDACEEHGEHQRHGHPEEGQRLSQLAPQVLVTSLHDFVHTHPIGRSFDERRILLSLP